MKENTKLAKSVQAGQLHCLFCFTGGVNKGKGLKRCAQAAVRPGGIVKL